MFPFDVMTVALRSYLPLMTAKKDWAALLSKVANVASSIMSMSQACSFLTYPDRLFPPLASLSSTEIS
jgi:hypothetical protein